MLLENRIERDKHASSSEKILERLKYPQIRKIRLEKILSKKYRNKHFHNCMLLLHTIDILTSIKIYNLKPTPKNQEEEKQRHETGEKITLSDLMEFFEASLEEIHKKYWEVYFKAVIHKKQLEKIHYPKEKRTIINYLNWLFKYGYLDKFKIKGFGSDEIFYKINDNNTNFNNFDSLYYVKRLTPKQLKGYLSEEWQRR